MRKLNTPVRQIGRFAGKWVVIDPNTQKIIAASKDLKEVGHLATRPATEKRPAGELPYAFLVPRKDEGPYIL